MRGPRACVGSRTNADLDNVAQMENETLAEPAAAADEVVEEELLIEEISIDGMCGVY